MTEGSTHEARRNEAPFREQGLAARQDIHAVEVLISGSQALLRVLLAQRELDRLEGRSTAGYVSGYRGSPLGGFDLALWKAKEALQRGDITFQPGLNEDLAVTAVSGTQQLEAYGPARVDGVFGLWYGKGPGVDRAGDALKHASYAGTHPQGGVLAVFGDDHPGKSSSVAHHSEQAMASFAIPVLYPSNVQDTVEFGLLGYAMSRYSGAWIGMKMVNETAEQTAVVRLRLEDVCLERPPAGDLLPPEGVHYRGVFGPLRDEEIVKQHRLPLAQRFARANRLDRVTVGDSGALGIVTAGKAYQDVRQALRLLGISEERARRLGLAVYKVGMIWPLEPTGLREFAVDRRELMFVEEKAAFVELQAAATLYNQPQRPVITGKADPLGRPLLPSEKPLEPVEVAQAIGARLQALGLGDAELAKRLDGLRAYRSAILSILPAGERRMPYFCSGCPHNSSTVLPEGSVAIAGIGCHGMAMWAKPRTRLSTQMGSEGLNWVGMQPFSKTKHVFQNLGDGTYFHSGSLAIRAAVAAQANITYKLLYNDAVAMTGGQPVDGSISVGQIAHQVLAEGVRRVVVLTEDLSRYAGHSGLPAGVQVLDRRQVQRVQKELRDEAGVTVMIYDQTCAAEKRRRRKAGRYSDPDQRVFINPEVCEGCGDCSAQSGCISIEPLDTELGRKRAINQSSCNKDFSCVQGFCPSFVSVRGARLRTPEKFEVPADLVLALPVPATASVEQPYGVMLAGIGGTGVVTVSAILAMAAHLEHKAPSTYDMTGLSQKNGAVFSHLRVAARPDDIHSQRLGLGEADLVLGFDLVSALADDAARTFGPRTKFVGNQRVQETAAFVADRDARVHPEVLQRKVQERVAAGAADFLDATLLAQTLFGDAIAANMILLGVAAQRGWLPVGLPALMRAIELNAVQVDFNGRAFLLGRAWVAQPDWVRRACAGAAPAAPATRSLKELVDHRAALLTSYQDAAYAQRFRRLVERVAAAEKAVLPGSESLTRAVAHNFAKLMAYKDEYEVARLHASPRFTEALRQQFSGDLRLGIYLAPPLFARRDPQTGHLVKREYGGWMLTALKALAPLKVLRGTRWDPFGYTAERRAERALVLEYEQTLERVSGRLNPGNLRQAVGLAEVPSLIRGFGHVKEAAMAVAAAKRMALLKEFESAGSSAAAHASSDLAAKELAA